MLEPDRSVWHGTCFTGQGFLKPCVPAGEMWLLLWFPGAGAVRGASWDFAWGCVFWGHIGLQGFLVLCVLPQICPITKPHRGRAGMRC